MFHKIIMFSDRTNWELTPNKLTILLEQLRQAKTTLYDLTESNPTNCGFSYPQEILKALVDPRNLRYEPQAQGLSEAREAICAYYKRKGIPIEPRQIFLTASTSEAYSFLLRLLLNPNEQALFPAPSYPLFQFLVDLHDVRMGNYPLVYRESWEIDCEEMKNNLSADTKAIVLVNPNNPTGSYIKSKELATINQLCQDHDLAIIADEVFLDYALDPQTKPISLAGNRSNLTFVLGGLSKTLALPQMKLAWIIVNGPSEKMAKAIERLEIIADTYLSVNTPVQQAVTAWLGLQNVVQKEVRERIQRNRDYILAHLGNYMECLHTEGGWYVVLKLAKEIDEEKLALELLQKDQVYVHPGYFFDFAEGSRIVLSLLPAEKIFQKGFNLFAQRIA